MNSSTILLGGLGKYIFAAKCISYCFIEVLCVCSRDGMRRHAELRKLCKNLVAVIFIRQRVDYVLLFTKIGNGIICVFMVLLTLTN